MVSLIRFTSGGLVADWRSFNFGGVNIVSVVIMELE